MVSFDFLSIGYFSARLKNKSEEVSDVTENFLSPDVR